MSTGIRRDLSRVFELVHPHNIRYIVTVILIGLPNAFLNIGIAFVMKLVLEYFTKPESTSLAPILAIVGGMLFGIVYMPIVAYRLNVRKEIIMRDIRVRIFDHLQSLRVSYFDTHHSGDVVARVNKDAEAFRGALDAFGNLADMVLRIALFLPYILILDLRFGAIAFGASLLATVINLRFVKPMREKSREIHEKHALLTEAITENVSGFSVIKLFGLSGHFISRFRSILDEVFNFQIDRMKLSATLYTANILIGWLNRGLLAVLGCLLAIQGELEIGVVVATIPVCTHLTFVLMFFSERLAGLQQSFAGVDRLYELFAEEPEPQRFARRDGGIDSGGLVVSNAVFGYTDETRVVDGISIAVDEGRKVALVGDSGGGKSTLVKLVASMYELDEGVLGYDGRQISDYTLEEWRDLIAYVPQDAYVFDGTIRENIVVARPDAPHHLVESVARKAHAHDFIISHAEGYETLVGERGVRLSGGERQRIAVARALLKDAPILLLDEATSSLDSESELHVQAALEELMEGRTSVVVAHRLSTIESAHEICFVKQGVITERGTHTELLAAGGGYAELYYRDFAHDRAGPGSGG